MKRALTILNKTGDKTIIWDPEDDEKIISIIQKKLDAGVSFFIIKPRLGGLLAPDKVPLKKVRDAVKHRALAIADEDFEKFVGESATADVIKTPEARVEVVKKSKSAKEIAASESVGVQPMQGG
jgi:hypothetical protein